MLHKHLFLSSLGFLAFLSSVLAYSIRATSPSLVDVTVQNLVDYSIKLPKSRSFSTTSPAIAFVDNQDTTVIKSDQIQSAQIVVWPQFANEPNRIVQDIVCEILYPKATWFRSVHKLSEVEVCIDKNDPITVSVDKQGIFIIPLPDSLAVANKQGHLACTHFELVISPKTDKAEEEN